MAIVKQFDNKAKKVTRTRFTLFEPYEAERRRYLRFDINALADFEQETGMGFAQLMQQKATFAAARALVWAGLKHEDRMLTIESVGILLGQYIKDPEATESRSINDVLLVVLDAGVEQGAFGNVKKKDDGNVEDVEDEEEKNADTVRSADPNAKAIEGEVIPKIDSPTSDTQG